MHKGHRTLIELLLVGVTYLENFAVAGAFIPFRDHLVLLLFFRESQTIHMKC